MKSRKNTVIDKWIAEGPIYKFRKKHHWSLQRLGKELGCSFQLIFNWQEGNNQPKASNLEKLLSKLNIEKEIWQNWIDSRPT